MKQRLSPECQGEMLPDPQARQDLLACLAEERVSIQAVQDILDDALGPLRPPAGAERPDAILKDIQDTLSVGVTHLSPWLVLLHR